MMGAAPSTLMDSPYHYSSNPVSTSCALVTAVKLVLHLNKRVELFAQEKMRAICKQFVSANLVFLGCKSIVGDTGSLERGKQTRVLALRTRKGKAAIGLGLKQKSYSLLRELLYCFSHPETFVLDRSGDFFPAVVAGFTATCHRLFVGCEPNFKCFGLPKDGLLKEFDKAALGADMNVILVGKKSAIADVVAELVPKVATFDLLFSPRDGLSL